MQVIVPEGADVGVWRMGRVKSGLVELDAGDVEDIMNIDLRVLKLDQRFDVYENE